MNLSHSTKVASQASAQDSVLALLDTPVQSLDDLWAGFTDNQWYCHLARQTVFFSASSDHAIDVKGALEMAREITHLAPHLLLGFKGAKPGQPISEELLSQIVSLEQVDDLTDYPDKWSMVGTDIFDNPDLPLFRIRVAARKNGADENGHFAAVLVLSTHSLFEGADAARLSRSRMIERGAVTTKPRSVSAIKKWSYKVLAAVLAPLQLVAATLFAPRVADVGYRSVKIERTKLRKAANDLGIRQQSLMFALATFALNEGGSGFSKKSIKALYADLSANAGFQTNDNFFQFRMIDLKLPVKNNFVDFAHSVDEAITKAEQGDKSSTQLLLNSMFGMHRWLHRHFAFLYSAQLFRFSAGYDLTLSLVPPQRLGGALTKGLVEPVYSGTYHPGFNMCVFAPGRNFITFSFCLRARHLKNVDNVLAWFDQVG